MTPPDSTSGPRRPFPVRPLALLAIVAAAAWMLQPTATGAAAVAGILILVGLASLAGPKTPSRLLWVVPAIALAAVMAWTGWRIRQVESDWPAEREARITAASDRLAGDLDAAFNRLEQLGADATEAARMPRAAAFDLLASLVPSQGPEIGLSLLDRAGVPIAWAGVHHRIPEPAGPAFASRSDGLYLLLDSRHRTDDGGAAVATMLVWAHAAAPGTEQSLAGDFRRRSGVGLEVYGPGLAPQGPDVFDYAYPDATAPDGRRLLFSVVPEPPEQSAAAAALRARAGGWILLLAVGMLLALVHDAPPRERRLAVPVLGALALAMLEPGPVYAIAATAIGAVTLLLVLLPLLPAAGRYRSLGATLLLAGPLTLAACAQLLPMPSPGVGSWGWVLWHASAVLVAAVPSLAGCWLMRAVAAPKGPTWPVGVSLLLSAGLLVVVLRGWQPGIPQPTWWPLAWCVALLPLLAPLAPRVRAIGAAVALGAAASALAWTGFQAQRVELATRDLASLGVAAEGVPSAELEAAVRRLARAPVPRSPTELFLRWNRDPLARGERPVVLGTWDTTGAAVATLMLDSLNLDMGLLGSFAASMQGDDAPALTRLVQSPGVHQVALARTGDLVSMVAIGPPSLLINRSRVGRLLLPPDRRADRYLASLGPPVPQVDSTDERVSLARDGWTVRGERNVVLPEGTRLAAVAMDLRGTAPIAIRVVLMLALDAALVLLLLALARWLHGSLGAPAMVGAVRRSFRMRLGVALALFFLAPAVAFTAWGLSRLAEDTARQRDALTQQVLREAGPEAAALLRGPDAEVVPGLRRLSTELDGELALYSGGVLYATSAPILRDMGVLSPLLDPAAFRTLASGADVDLVQPGGATHGGGRVGYRVVQAGAPATVGIVATPQVIDDGTLRREQVDLALALMAAVLLGGIAAGAAAGAVARALARPVRELRQAAMAIGAGEEPVLPETAPPAEFAPVFSAMDKLSTDVRASQEALEAARARTAAVLRTVTTGVVALDRRGRVLLANPRAEELLGYPLPEGAALPQTEAGNWQRFMHRDADDEAELEFERAGRQLRAEVARLPGPEGGVVVALNDVTAAGRAARVLAWGEMARQVAHEIKNPLTPLRLGIQHLQRAWRRDPEGYAEVLDETGQRVLAEIDRLDTIARIFSRFGAPAELAGPLEPVDLAAVVSEVATLYQLAEEGAVVRVSGEPAAVVPARRDELKEVLVNLLENARNAGAGEIVMEVAHGMVAVRDDGHGIPTADLPRVFEPRFSTTTSGSGLGLAIVRRLVEGWGGTIHLDSAAGRGTSVTIRLAATPDRPSPPGE